MITARSVEAIIVVGSVSVLFAGLESVSVTVTVAVLDNDPRAVGLTVPTRVIVAEAPLASVPTLAVTVPFDWLTVPRLEDPETNVRLAGKGSLTVTPVAVDGPLFVTTSV